MEKEVSQLLTVLAVGAFVLFLIFLILRELMCWYWKINQVIVILENIQRDMHSLAQSRTQTDELPAQSTPIDPSHEICPFCKEASLTENRTCEHCGQNKR